MKKLALGIYGAGGLGLEVMSLVPTVLNETFPGFNQRDIYCCFIDDNVTDSRLLNREVLTPKDFLGLNNFNLSYTIAIADPKARERISKSKGFDNMHAASLIFSKTSNCFQNKIGRGVIIMPGAVISTMVTVGDFTIVNFNTYIAHNCYIGNYVTISPSVVCCGYVKVEDSVFIGAGSNIINGTREKNIILNKNSKLGMGSNLLNDTESDQVYVGNPAKPIKIRK
jgi:sugar O-acyltransferase (sialic acid O-acetyltransferase NeuD family)